MQDVPFIILWKDVGQDTQEGSHNDLKIFGID